MPERGGAEGILPAALSKGILAAGQAGRGFGPTPGPPEPCLVFASGLMVYEVHQRLCKVCLLCVLAEAEPSSGLVTGG